MKYKVGDKVRIKSIDWYNKNKTSEFGDIDCGAMPFMNYMVEFCNRIVTISNVNSKDGYYDIEEDGDTNGWTDEMIEGLVEEPITLNGKEIPLKLVNIELPSGATDIWECPKGYQFIDENGNVIKATKIVLEKKKKEYPKTYEECRKIMDIDTGFLLTSYDLDFWKGHLLTSLQKLLICRNAYWKIAGEEMGLGKPWEPDWTNENQSKYGLFEELKTTIINPASFVFPTEEMRNAFKDNFDKDLETCKELL